MIGKTRRFGGKTYRLVASYYKKEDAVVIAGRFRAHKEKTRMVSAGGRYYLYIVPTATQVIS